jgi:hypothetical protein
VPPVQTNATLRKVSRGGGREEPGSSTPAGDGDAAFEGAVRIYYQEKRERVVTNAGVDVRIRRILHVDTRSPAIEWREEDQVLFVRDRGGEETGTVQNVTAAELGEFAGSGVETSRLELEPK